MISINVDRRLVNLILYTLTNNTILPNCDLMDRASFRASLKKFVVQIYKDSFGISLYLYNIGLKFMGLRFTLKDSYFIGERNIEERKNYPTNIYISTLFV